MTSARAPAVLCTCVSVLSYYVYELWNLCSLVVYLSVRELSIAWPFCTRHIFPSLCRKCHMGEEATMVGDLGEEATTTVGDMGEVGGDTTIMEDGAIITIITITVDVGVVVGDGDGDGDHTDMLATTGELFVCL